MIVCDRCKAELKNTNGPNTRPSYQLVVQLDAEEPTKRWKVGTELCPPCMAALTQAVKSAVHDTINTNTRVSSGGGK
jgi:hypothetical protein